MDHMTAVSAARARSRGVEGSLQPLQTFAVDCHDIEAARRNNPQVRDETLRCEHETRALGCTHARCGAAVPRVGTGANLDKDQRAVALAADQIDLTAAR
jgi:hypothetical protein